MQDLMAEARGLLRHEPVERRVRASLEGRPVADSARALIVWEPRRICPSYAVPAEDLLAELTPAPQADEHTPGLLHPGIPFSVHSAEGEAVTVAGRVGAGYRLDDLDGHVVLDFDAFDWLEEDELRPSPSRSFCPYKGEASWWSLNGQDDLGWTYEQPMPELPAIAGMVAFWDELVDVFVDGEPRERPGSVFSELLLEEFGA